MDFKDQIKQLADRISKLKDNISTEEATKNAMIMPFIQTLGYDVFNPLEVVPEFTCDIGIKKGEKIDYAIMQDDEPVILIECKHWQQDLNLHDNQLLRYFNVANAKFGILTNGIVYRFYTDLETTNKMDEKPFLEINLFDLKDNQIEELKKFHKSYFDIESVLSSASELKYTNELKRLITDEFANPSPDFVRLFARQAYDGLVTQKVLDQFTELMKKSLQNYVNDKITERLKSAMEKQENTEGQSEETSKNAAPKEEHQDGIVYQSEDGSIITTQEEIDGYLIAKAILAKKVDTNRIAYRDGQTYFSVLLDDNNRKTLCRLYLNSAVNKYFCLLDDNRKEVRYNIDKIQDLYKYTDEILCALDRYLKGNTEVDQSNISNEIKPKLRRYAMPRIQTDEQNSQTLNQ